MDLAVTAAELWMMMPRPPQKKEWVKLSLLPTRAAVTPNPTTRTRQLPALTIAG